MASERPHPVAPRGTHRSRTVLRERFSMASERPHLVAPSFESAFSLLGAVEFQWPLSGHTSLRLGTASAEAAPLVAFQWPLSGHTSLRPVGPSGYEWGRLSVSMASERP